jgi:poly-beta-1,6-N-acetyl-D-glucosamine synthase
MLILLIIFYIIFIIYGIMIYDFNNNFNQNPRVTPINGHNVPVSVIIAVKNGEKSLPQLIECLMNQTYNGEVEYIFVDDQSVDNTKNIIESIAKEDMKFKFVSSEDGDNELSFKKKALDAGIKSAKHEWLLFTDVDCRPPEQWVEEMVEYFTEDADYVIGMSKVIPNKSFVSQFQCIDFQMLMSATYAQTNKQKPWACTGQNQAYRKSLFQKIGGFSLISKLLQGDDSIFMQVCKKAGAKIIVGFTKHPMIARTENNWISFLKQRMRWAGDTQSMIFLCPEFFIASVITFLAHIAPFIILIFTEFTVNSFMIFIIIKFSLEILLYESLNKTVLTTKKNEPMFIVWFIVHFPYIVLMGIMSFGSHKLFGWKK